MKKNIKKISFYDFDSTLVDSPQPEWGKTKWEEKKGVEYPHIGWWGKPESLDLDVFSVKPINSVVELIKKDIKDPHTYVVILTSRIHKLEDTVRAFLEKIHIYPDRYDLKKNNKSKGERVLDYFEEFPDVVEIDVYDDNYEREISSYLSIIDKLPEKINFSIYYIENEEVKLINENRVVNIIKEEVLNFYEL